VQPFINFATQSTFTMKAIHEYEKDLASIRTMMERSVKFISLSGLSGVLAGIYALAGAVAAYFIVHYPVPPWHYRIFSVNEPERLWKLLMVAFLVLAASLATGLWLSHRKAKKYGLKLWGPATYKLILNLSIPLVSGGIFILIMLYSGHFGLAAPASLLFYGLALIQGSTNTFDEVRYLGYCEITLGLTGALFPGYGLLFWALGFGVLHIIYGTIMYKKYDK
jgi:hypothetical protein